MKKISKIDTARIIYRLGGKCCSNGYFVCKDCFNYSGGCKSYGYNERKASALAYILRYSRKPEEVARLRADEAVKIFKSKEV